MREGEILPKVLPFLKKTRKKKKSGTETTDSWISRTSYSLELNTLYWGLRTCSLAFLEKKCSLDFRKDNHFQVLNHINTVSPAILFISRLTRKMSMLFVWMLKDFTRIACVFFVFFPAKFTLGHLHLKIRSASFRSFKVKCGMRWIFGWNLQNSCWHTWSESWFSTSEFFHTKRVFSFENNKK